jgi:hypothetical protein
MGGILERLRGLLGGGDGDVTEVTLDTARQVDQERAIDAVDAGREDAQADALFAMTDTPGGIDD